MILLLCCVADIDKLAILEENEVVLLRKRFEAGDGLLAEVRDQVNVSFEYCDVWTELCKGGNCKSLNCGGRLHQCWEE